MSEIIVYGKPACPNCNSLKNVLKGKSIEFKYVDISAEGNEDLRLDIMSQGFRSLPVVKWEDKLYSFNKAVDMIVEEEMV